MQNICLQQVSNFLCCNNRNDDNFLAPLLRVYKDCLLFLLFKPSKISFFCHFVSKRMRLFCIAKCSCNFKYAKFNHNVGYYKYLYARLKNIHNYCRRYNKWALKL